MKKRFILLLLLILFIPCVKAEGELIIVDNYIDGHAYSEGELVTDTWAFDIISNTYIKLDSEGVVTREITDMDKDSTMPRGNIHIKALVPDNMKDKKINVVISNTPYGYNYTLDSSNNFEINQNIIATNYYISYVAVVDYTDEYEVFYPTNINVLDGDTTTIELDYMKYKEENKNEDKNNKKDDKTNTYILYVFVGVVSVFVIVLSILYIKAKNI
jgi:hypothetical protein